MTNPNVNCLEGWQCPNCGSYGPFNVACETIVRLWDDGSDQVGDLDFDEDSWAGCVACGHDGTVGGMRK